MSHHSRVLAVFALLITIPAFASTHVWFGTTSDRMSDPLNWSGGSPAGDPDAILIFPPEAERFNVVNDIDGLRFRELRFEERGFAISGAPMQSLDGTVFTVNDVTISNELRISGTLRLSGRHVALSGAISGSGGIEMTRSTVRLTGAASNTYEGETTVHSATLALEKSAGAIAIPGNLRSTGSISPSFVHVTAAEQIANDATVRMERGSITLFADETIARLELGGQVLRGGIEVPTLTVDTIVVLSESGIRTNLRVANVETEFASLSVSRNVIVPDSGITLRGGGTVRWASDTTGPTRVEGVRAELEVPNSAVRMTSGSFEGKAASLSATGGTIDGGIEVGGDLRLGAGVTVNLHVVRLNGFLSLGGATLRLGDRELSGSSAIIIDNASTQPAFGRFAGLPDGAIIENRYLISYSAGDGNDVALIDLRKPEVTLTMSQEPAVAFVGEPFTLRVVVSGSRGTPTGTVTFSRFDGDFDGASLGTATIVDGVATLQLTSGDDDGTVLVRYNGDATYASARPKPFPFEIAYRPPVITSIDPSSGAPGEVVRVTVRGEHFLPGTFLDRSLFTDTEFSSSTELRSSINLVSFRAAEVLSVVAVQPDGTRSEPVPFSVTPVEDASSMLMFDEAGPFAHVSAGAKTAWLTSAEDLSATFFEVDDDRDGRVQWPRADPRGIFAVVDLATGEFDVRAAGGALREAAELPLHTFARDANGNVSRFVLSIAHDGAHPEWRILLARPGVGAWHLSITDGEDLDGVRNGLLFGSIESMIPYGDSPMHPSGFARGDVVIAMSPGAGLFSHSSSLYFAERLGELFAEHAPGVVQAASRNYEFFENQVAARLPVIRTNGSSGAATVRYTTLSRSAMAGVDFVAKSGTLMFGPGEILKTIEIPLIDHDGYRATNGELFHVVLSDATGATLGDETVFVVRILSNDAPPRLTIVGAERRQVRETDAPQPYTIELHLTGPTKVPASVQWKADVVGSGPQSGEVTFAPGEWRKSVMLQLPGDIFDSGPHFMRVRFHAVQSATLAGPTEIEITILEDDAPVLTGFDLSIDESDFLKEAYVNFSLNPAKHATYSWETADGTATPADYVPQSGQLKFTDRDGNDGARIPILDDELFEGDETFTVEANGVVATVTIRDDELPLSRRPFIDVLPATVAEPLEAGVAAFEVTLSFASTLPVSAHLVTGDSSAVGGVDYQLTDETIVFEPGETKKTFLVPIFGDSHAEGDETFQVILRGMLNGQVRRIGATGTILKNEPQPRRTRAVRH